MPTTVRCYDPTGWPCDAIREADRADKAEADFAACREELSETRYEMAGIRDALTEAEAALADSADRATTATIARRCRTAIGLAWCRDVARGSRRSADERRPPPRRRWPSALAGARRHLPRWTVD